MNLDLAMNTLVTLLHTLVLAAQHVMASFASSFAWALVIGTLVGIRFYREKQRHELARLALEKGQPLPRDFFHR